ncbi:ATP-binding protein [Salinimicrobium tongyeongense]|uniref:ATP-binding protein n=1 Tax=Salinimicrobium tongyeongense TaxID=2809707 RepID=A0ABY6NNH0_9FLAO|nr:tetratricopeptide repeat-containing sensor histidine kinase [Salinimicrobium tongyeongense]UZH54398.1 ATP-binding protein [Salinimicrobium tongyeongense]
MKCARILNFFVVFCLAALSACESKDSNKEQAQPAPGTPGQYYLLGLDTSDPPKKLELYNKGLNAVTDKRDTSLVALLDGKIYALQRLGQVDSLPFWIDSLIITARLQGDLFYEAKGFLRKSEIMRNKNPEEQFKNAFYSRNLYLKYGDTAMAGRRSLDMANAQLGLGDIVGSQESATEAIKYLDHTRDAKYVSSAYNVLGLSYSGQKLFSEAFKEYEQALKYAVSREDSISYLHNIALLHKSQENYSEALKTFGEILKSDVIDESSRLRYRENYAFTKWLQDSTTRAGDVLLEVMRKRREMDDQSGLIASYFHLTDYFRKIDINKSKHYAEKYYEQAKLLSYPTAQAEALRRLISLSEGNTREKYIERFLLLSDSLEEADTRLRYQFAKIRFDEEKKEQQIDLLQAENTTQHLRTEKLRTRNIIISLAALIILVISGAFFYSVRQRGKREKIKQIYLTERRISKRIHDELANDIYHVMSSIEPVAPAMVVDRLENIYQRTRDFSRENSEIATGEDYLSGLLNMLSGAVPSGMRLIVRGETGVNWGKMSRENKIVVYRVLQEMMVNMRKHSEAKLVALIFSTEEKYLKISYSDNGIGVDEAVLQCGNGVQNLKARLKTIKGNVIFDTSGKGLKAEFFVPFNS